MFKSVRIQNFRQFKDLTLDNLAQINLITGANNTGKTSLLEALFLHASANAASVLTITDLRGIAGVVAEGLYAWGFIFRDGVSDRPIIVDSVGTDDGPKRLEVSVSESQDVLHEPPTPANGSASSHVISTASAPSP